MNRTETLRLLDQFYAAYPAAYRHMDAKLFNSNVQFWLDQFHDVPYDIMVQAFGRFRVHSPFPPTVYQMYWKLCDLYFEAEEAMWIHRQMENTDLIKHDQMVMECTSRFLQFYPTDARKKQDPDSHGQTY